MIRQLIEILTFKKVKKARRRQALGFLAGFCWAGTVLFILITDKGSSFSAHGPMNTGHENLQCQSCHHEAEGSLRQQLQANAKFTLGLRDKPADFGLKKVDNAVCTNCHDRPDDRHPAHRFTEARFVEARKAIDVTQCNSCHNEHKGVRMSVAAVTFCNSCHQDLKMKNDPLEVPHADLIKNALWQTCSQCHDFHGNHDMKLAKSLKDTIPVEKIRIYLTGGQDPYSKIKFTKAKNQK